MKDGDVYYLPRASYPHHIEVAPDWHFLIFFDQPLPADIGYRAYFREVLAATFNTRIDPADRQPHQPPRLSDL